MASADATFTTAPVNSAMIRSPSRPFPIRLIAAKFKKEPLTEIQFTQRAAHGSWGSLKFHQSEIFTESILLGADLNGSIEAADLAERLGVGNLEDIRGRVGAEEFIP